MSGKNSDYSKWRNGTISAKVETDKKYMILRMGSSLVSTAGLGWYILHTFIGIEIALENGYIPVVDWENCKLPQYPYESCRRNVWEIFFEQPCEVGLREAYESENYWIIDDILAIKGSRDFFLKDYTDFYAVEDRRERFRRYVRFNEDFRGKIDAIAGEMIDGRSLGVLIRGTDYKNIKPMHHPKCIPLEKIFGAIDDCLEHGSCDRIFVATEDKEILDVLKKKYSGKLSYLESPRYEQVGNQSLNLYRAGKTDGEYRDSQYLLSLAILARCSSLVLSPCGGSVVASLLHDNVIQDYRLCFEGYYSHKAYVFASKLEAERGELVYLNNRPLIYYSLNTLFLMKIADVTIVTSSALRKKLEPVLHDFACKGINIRYIDGSENDVCSVLKDDIAYYQDEALCLFYEDNIFYGSYLGKEMNQKAKQFDGAYVWKKSADIQLTNWEAFAGCFLFDQEISNVVRQCVCESKEFSLDDILDCYRDNKKLICTDLPRGAVCVKIQDEKTARNISELFGLLEEELGHTIGDALGTADTLKKMIR